MEQVVTVWADTSASYDDSPRSWDNLGTMVCAHHRYDLPQESGYTTDSAGYEELVGSLRGSKRCGRIVLPVYMYDHSGTTLSTTPFSCQWGSGQVGYIYVDYTDIRKAYPEWRIITAKRREIICKQLQDEVATYSQWQAGDVYGFTINVEPTPAYYNEYFDLVPAVEGYYDSCGGFYGSDTETNGMRDYVPEKYWGALAAASNNIQY